MTGLFSKPTAAVAHIGTERADGEQAGAAAHSAHRCVLPVSFSFGKERNFARNYEKKIILNIEDWRIIDVFCNYF